MKLIASAACAALVSCLAFAQGAACGSTLLMSEAGNGGQNGVSFDVYNKTPDPVVLCGLDVSLDPGIHTVQVWQVTNGTSAIAAVNNPAHWTLIASSTVTSLGTSTTGVSTVFTPFPAMNVLLQPGATAGFMVSTASGSAINYTTGNATTSPVGATFAQDANIELRVGHGRGFSAALNGPFGSIFGSANGGRIANVRVGYYTTVGMPRWQVNTAGSTLTGNGQSTTSPYGTNYGLAKTCVNQPITVGMNSIGQGLPWELASTMSPPVPLGQGAMASAGGEVLNLNVFDPTLSFMLGLSFAIPFGANTSYFSIPVPFGMTFQMVNANPAAPDGFSLSSAVRLEVEASPSFAVWNGTAIGDDDVKVLTANVPTGPGSCATPMPAVPFYGAAKTQLWVASNGRVLFDGGSGYMLSSPLEAFAQTFAPMVGFWTDFSPSTAAGSELKVDWSVPNLVSVSYTNMPYVGFPLLRASGAITFDTVTGAITITGMNSFPIYPLTELTSNWTFLGISRGNGVATDPLMANFVPGATGTAASPTDMLYMIGTSGTFAQTVQSLTFTPSANGGYSYAAF